MRSLRAAFAVLTRVPVGGFPYSDRDWARAPGYFPLVGALVGGAAGLLALGLSPLGPLAAAVAGVVGSLGLTGAMHEDGLADTADALGGAGDRQRVFEILKDSRIGTYGAAALILSLLGRVVLLGRLGSGSVWPWVLSACAARAAPVLLLVTLPYVTPPVAAKNLAVSGARWPQALLALAFVGVCLALAWREGAASPARLGAVLLAVGLVALSTGYWYRRRLGGVTGDFLGATEQLGELAILAVLAWAP